MYNVHRSVYIIVHSSICYPVILSYVAVQCMLPCDNIVHHSTCCLVPVTSFVLYIAGCPVILLYMAVHVSLQHYCTSQYMLPCEIVVNRSTMSTCCPVMFLYMAVHVGILYYSLSPSAQCSGACSSNSSSDIYIGRHLAIPNITDRLLTRLQ